MRIQSVLSFVQDSEKKENCFWTLWEVKLCCLLAFHSFERMNCFVFLYRRNCGLFSFSCKKENKKEICTITILLLCNITYYYNLLSVWYLSKQPYVQEWHLTHGTHSACHLPPPCPVAQETPSVAPALVSPEPHAASLPAAAETKVDSRARADPRLGDAPLWWHCRGQAGSPPVVSGGPGTCIWHARWLSLNQTGRRTTYCTTWSIFVLAGRGWPTGRPDQHLSCQRCGQQCIGVCWPGVPILSPPIPGLMYGRY